MLSTPTPTTLTWSALVELDPNLAGLRTTAQTLHRDHGGLRLPLACAAIIDPLLHRSVGPERPHGPAVLQTRAALQLATEVVVGALFGHDDDEVAPVEVGNTPSDILAQLWAAPSDAVQRRAV
jgi:hypothetical protein